MTRHKDQLLILIASKTLPDKGLDAEDWRPISLKEIMERWAPPFRNICSTTLSAMEVMTMLLELYQQGFIEEVWIDDDDRGEVRFRASYAGISYLKTEVLPNLVLPGRPA